MKRSSSPTEFLWNAASQFQRALPDSAAGAFLEGRGIREEEARQFGLGFVDENISGIGYRGWLAIPYMRKDPRGKWSVATIRFRCVRADCDHKHHGGKYMPIPGTKGGRLYNTVELERNADTIAICEGELDAVTATLCGVPAVGVHGVDQWEEHFTPLFEGYELVHVLADNDDKGQGMRFADSVAKRLPNARVVPMASGHDVNSMVLALGRHSLKERIES